MSASTASTAVRRRLRAAGRVRLIQIAGICVDHALLLVDKHVQDKLQARLMRGEEHILMNGIALKAALHGARTGQEAGIVVVQHGLFRGDARQDRLAPAGEACEEVRLDEALGHDQLGPVHQVVDPQLAAGGQYALEGHIVHAAGDVVDDRLARDDFLAELVDHFLARGRPVHAGGDQYADFGVGRALAKLLKVDG